MNYKESQSQHKGSQRKKKLKIQIFHKHNWSRFIFMDTNDYWL